MRRQAPEVLTTAKAQRWDPAEAVRALLTEELAGRRASSINIRRTAAGFPTGKTFDTWDETVSSIPAPTQRSLTTLEWVDRHENLVVCGPSGTGKTHLLEALGHAAIGHGCHVQWFSLETLGALINRHRVDDSTSRAISKIMRADLICIDDIGLLPGHHRDRRSALPRRRRRLRETLHRPVLEPAPRRVRRADAQDDRQRHRRPAPAPRPRRHHQRRLDPPHPSNPRQRGEATDQLNPGQIHWPSVGNSDGHQRAVPLTAHGQILLALDTFDRSAAKPQSAGDRDMAGVRRRL